MAKLPGSYNVNDVDDSDDFDPVPAGWYPMELTKNEWKDSNKDPDNKYIACTLSILGDDYNGRLIWLNLNLVNKHPKAVSIAEKDLARLTKSCGFEEVDDVDELMNIPFEGKLVVKEETANFPAKNEIKGFRQYEDSAPPSKAEAKPSGSAESEKKTKPWLKKNK